MNTYLKYQPAAIQFLAFLAFSCGFFLLSYIVTTYFFQDVNSVLLDKNAIITPGIIARFKLAQLASAVITFLIPALLFGYYSSPKALPYIGIQQSVSVIILAACVALLLAIQPMISYLGYANEHIDFGSLKQYITQVEAMYDRAMKVFLEMHSTGDLLFNLFIMALLPAVSEELFFRGALQKVLVRVTGRPWLAILLSAILFAMLHGTLLKIIPIFVLGLLLGFVYHITRNLWYTITIHFINNSFALIAFYYADKNSFFKKISDDNTVMSLYLVIASLAVSAGIIYFMNKKSEEVFPAAITNEDNDFIA